MLQKGLWITSLLILLTACSEKSGEVSIFSIPDDATPSELEANGFTIARTLNGLGEVDKLHDGGIEACRLDLVYASVSATYAGEDTSRIHKYVIRIDMKPFEKMTGFQAKNYVGLEIEGYKYNVEVNEDDRSMILKRLE